MQEAEKTRFILLEINSVSLAGGIIIKTLWQFQPNGSTIKANFICIQLVAY